MAKNRAHRLLRQELQNRIVLHALDQVAKRMHVGRPDGDAVIFVIEAAAGPRGSVVVEHDLFDHSAGHVDRLELAALQIAPAPKRLRLAETDGAATLKSRPRN